MNKHDQILLHIVTPTHLIRWNLGSSDITDFKDRRVLVKQCYLRPLVSRRVRVKSLQLSHTHQEKN